MLVFFAILLICLCLLKAGVRLTWLLLVFAVAGVISGVQHQMAAKAIAEGYSEFADLSVTALEPESDESIVSWASRLNRSIYEGTAHCHPADFAMTWLERALTWIVDGELFVQGILLKERFVCGYCHQRAYLFSEQLRRQGVESNLLGLYGHVVATFSDGVRTFVADPDYGVGPFVFDDTTVESASATVQSAYSSHDADIRNLLTGFYVSLRNNGPYQSNDALDSIRDDQRRFFVLADSVSLLLLILSALFFISMAARLVHARLSQAR